MILAAFFLVGGIAVVNAQDIHKNNIPKIVKSTFTKQFPAAMDEDWELKGANYEVDFDLNKVDHKAIFSEKGKRISFQKDIPNTKLPVKISKSIKEKYPKGRIDDVDLINTNGKITYKIDIEGVPDVNVWYESSGKFIKEVAD